MNEQTDLPAMSSHEASWHEHIAGMRAGEAARAAGANPAAVAAVAAATAGPAVVGGMRLESASQGTIWTLQRAAREYAALADAQGLAPAADPARPGTRELIELGLTTLIFMDARGVWKLLDAGGLPDLIARAEAIMWDMPLAANLALQAHFNREMSRIRELTGGADPDAGAEKKTSQPMPATGPSPAPPIPPPAPASPPSSGLPQSIPTLPFPTPFGACL
jgi:hypothetical protein